MGVVGGALIANELGKPYTCLITLLNDLLIYQLEIAEDDFKADVDEYGGAIGAPPIEEEGSSSSSEEEQKEEDYGDDD